MSHHECWGLADDDALARYVADRLGAPRSNSVPIGVDDPHPVGELTTPPPPTCTVCHTPLGRFGDAGWRQLSGFAARGGCQLPWPESGYCEHS